MMESEGKMTTTDARGWINALIKAMHEETSGSWPDPKYKDEVYSALEMAIQALSQEPNGYVNIAKDLIDDEEDSIFYQEPCEDVVSRDAVIKAVDAHTNEDGTLDDDISVILEDLPSVTPMRDATPEEQKSVNDYIKSISTPTGVKFNDAISRDAVLNAICDYVALGEFADKSRTFTVRPLEKRINDLPSVTQKSETVTEFADRCRECGARYGKYRKKAKRWKNKWLKAQKSGKWLITPMSNIAYCSECDYLFKDIPASIVEHFKHCPNCGAKMVEPQESEE